MSSDQSAAWRWAESGFAGRRALLNEYKRQLRWLPKWLAAQKRIAAQSEKRLRAKIAKLEKTEG